jgi:hypothetical protein
MLKAHQVEELVCVVSALGREALLGQFHTYRASFPVDFTDAYLQALSTERLRHLFLAVCLQSQRMPELPAAA